MSKILKLFYDGSVQNTVQNILCSQEHPLQQYLLLLGVNMLLSRAGKPTLDKLQFGRVLSRMKAKKIIIRVEWRVPCEFNSWLLSDMVPSDKVGLWDYEKHGIKNWRRQF